MAQQRRWSAEETRRRLREARTRLRSEQVDFAAELAELLVPNVRPVRTQTTDCGPIGEIDYGVGRETMETMFERLTSGTPLAGSDYSRFAAILRQEDDLSPGPRCNAELRRGFAEYLRRSLDPQQLQDAWQFLGARQREVDSSWSVYHRLIRFEGNARSPPVRWTFADQWLRDQVERALRRTAWGPALVKTLDSFWAERGRALGDEAEICPDAFSEWTRTRKQVVARMLERDAERRRRASRQP